MSWPLFKPFRLWDIVVDPGGDAWGIPILRINGEIHKDVDAYELLGERICKAAGKGPLECGCALK